MRKGIGHEIGKRRVPDHTKTAPRGVKTPQDAPRPRSWSQLGPKRGPKIDPKSIKIRAWEPPRPKTPQDPPKTPKWTPKWIPNRCEIDFEIHSKFIHHRCEMRVQTLLEACRYASMQVCRYAGMRVCRYAGM